jgi:tetratricopeptide (TPR) repeat protein
MFWLVLRRLKVPWAWMAAAVFAVHPVMVESVAWITERKNVLAGLFYFLSLWSYLRFDPMESDSSRSRDQRWWYVAFICFVAALASKTITCSLPAAILVLVWWKRGRITWQDIAPTLPMFALGLASGLFTSHLEKTHVWAGESDYHYSLLERSLIAGRVVWFYAGTLVWPTDLAFIHPRWHIDKGQWWQWQFPMAAVALLIVSWAMRKRITRDPLAALLLFGGTLFPAMGFFDIYPLRFSFVADHFSYLAAAWLIAGIAGVIASVSRRWQVPREVTRIAGAVVLLVLGTLTWNQQRIYTDPETLWRDTLIKNPECWMAMNNLGVIMVHQSQAEAAIELLNQCLAIKPDYYIGRNNLGTAYLLKGNVSGAEEIFRRVLEMRPDYPMGHMNLGLSLARQGRWSEAELEYRAAIKGDSNLSAMLKSIGTALDQQGHSDMALRHFELYVQFEPRDIEAMGQRDALRTRLGGTLGP